MRTKGSKLRGNTTKNMNILISKNRTLAFLAVLGLVASSASAAVVWDLNPNHLDGPVGSSTLVVASQPPGNPNITASGFDNNGGTGTPHQLFFKNKTEINGAVEFGLGLVGTTSNEVQTANGVPVNFIQLDLSSILPGFTNGQIKVGSVQSGETFQLFGSNTNGTLGTLLGVFGSTFDDQFLAIPAFGAFNFISVAAGSGDVLPIAFQADKITPVPEMSALLPIVALLVVIGASSLLRRRRLSSSV